MPSTQITIHNKLETTPSSKEQQHPNSLNVNMNSDSKSSELTTKGNVTAISTIIGEDGKLVKRHKDQQEREKWGKSIEFILSSMAFCIGLGNVWRFPYLCYKNGGGAFLIPYFICLFCGGIPVFFLEVALGQFTSQGGITVWRLCKIFKGIGYASCIIAFFLNIYYIVIIAWALHYLFASLSGHLPWAECGNEWNTKTCFDPSKLKLANENISLTGGSVVKFEGKDAVVEYWENRVLGISSGIDELGSIQWELAGTLLLAWVLCYFCIFKGIKTSGKVVYFTATFPYLMMTILLIRGLTLPGAADGIKYYLSPNFSMIWNTQVWIDAGTQIFFSYAIALGTMTALGSYNEFHHNFLKDCTVITCFNTGTSLYAGFVIFSVLGFMAHVQGIPINSVAEKGPGLAFIAYPKAITQMGDPIAQCIFSICFFLMILMLGLGSQFVGVEGFVTAVIDVIPHILRVGYRRQIFVAIVSLISYLIGLLMVTNGGMYVFQLFDYYSASGMCLLWVCLFQCIAIAWVSPGIGTWMVNIKIMLTYEPHWFWKYWLPICWSYVTPLLTGAILLSYFVNYEPLTYNKIYEYPFWAQVVGWLLALSSMLAIPFYFIYFQLTRAMSAADKEYELSKKLHTSASAGVDDKNVEKLDHV